MHSFVFTTFGDPVSLSVRWVHLQTRCSLHQAFCYLETVNKLRSAPIILSPARSKYNKYKDDWYVEKEHQKIRISEKKLPLVEVPGYLGWDKGSHRVKGTVLLMTIR